MSLPDPLTVAEILGETLIVIAIFIRVGEAQKAISEITDRQETNSSAGLPFAVTMSKTHAYGLAALPLGLLALYLVLYAMAGFPTWNSNPEGFITHGYYVPGAIFFLILTLLPPLVLVFGKSNEFFIVSNSGVAKFKGRKEVISISWKDVTAFDLSDDSTLPEHICVAGNQGKLCIDAQVRTIINRDMFCRVALERVPEAAITERLLKWAGNRFSLQAI